MEVQVSDRCIFPKCKEYEDFEGKHRLTSKKVCNASTIKAGEECIFERSGKAW